MILEIILLGFLVSLLLHLGSHHVFVVATNTNEGERVTDKLGLHVLVENTGGTERREAVNLKHPGFVIAVEDDVEAINFEATFLPVANFVHLIHYWFLG